jgi:hypothetical protein
MAREVTREMIIAQMNRLRVKANSLRDSGRVERGNYVTAAYIYGKIAETATDLGMLPTALSFLNAAVKCSMDGNKPDAAGIFESRARTIEDRIARERIAQQGEAGEPSTSVPITPTPEEKGGRVFTEKDLDLLKDLIRKESFSEQMIKSDFLYQKLNMIPYDLFIKSMLRDKTRSKKNDE